MLHGFYILLLEFKRTVVPVEQRTFNIRKFHNAYQMLDLQCRLNASKIMSTNYACTVHNKYCKGI